MLYVVVREIEGAKREAAAFRSRQDAQDAYDEAARICDEGPDDGPGDDPAIVTNCWLGWVDTPDRDIAKRSSLAGHFTVSKAYFPTPQSHS